MIHIDVAPHSPNMEIIIDLVIFLARMRPGFVHISEDHDYIHANWVDGYRESRKFIITQAPLPHTRSQFWKMLWQEKSLIVVSMIQMFDVTGAEWAPTYIPKKTGEIYRVDDMELLHCGTRRVTYKGEERSLLHLCYFSWGYRGTPKKPTEVLNFIADINYNRELLIKQAVGAGWLKSNESSPIVIHCLAGTAKSAVIAALDICLRKLDDTAKRKCGPLVDVEDVVLRLRTQRAMAIQKPEQYLFIHLAVLEYAVRQRYVADEMYNDFDLEGFFYERKSTDEGGRKTQEKKADPNNDNSKGIDQDTK
ncbi:Protein-tyrosine phosphatase [Dictyocaulus viviparus]|uniref:protein-tyrosine-phosphatase n=1 Tax=Dictyocaulus viviparus TaxID=29172 RepID=A0A0D8XEL8_DICVI|nr:Protein-tyrosine phosphatase [Dictyocaulus viviparus]